MRRHRSSIAASPVLIGATTTLLIAIAVFLAYNANRGLPFVPTYRVDVDLPDAAQLVVGNDVRVGGSRVGVVDAIEAVPGPKAPVARVTLALEQAVKPLSQSTRVAVRTRSNLGSKYVELVPGRVGDAPIAEGGRLPLRQAVGAVDLDEALTALDAPTRRALRQAVRGLGDGLAGRGGDLGRSIEEAPAALDALREVATTLTAPETDLTGFLRGAGSAMAAVAPVRDALGSFVSAGAGTFEALDAETPALRRALDVAPGAAVRAGRGLTALRPVLTEARGLLREARPGLELLPSAARRTATALRVSGPILTQSRPLAADLGTTLSALRTLARRPSTAATLRRLQSTVGQLGEALPAIVPFQTRCNYLGLWGRNVPSVVSEGDRLGTWFRFIPVVAVEEELMRPTPAPTLHADVAPDTGAGGQCDVGNQPWVPGQSVGTGPAVTADRTESTAPPEGVR